MKFMLELLSEQSESTRTQAVTQRVPLDILVTVNKLTFSSCTINSIWYLLNIYGFLTRLTLPVTLWLAQTGHKATAKSVLNSVVGIKKKKYLCYYYCDVDILLEWNTRSRNATQEFRWKILRQQIH